MAKAKPKALSKSELAEIARSAELLSVEEIAEKLGRTPEVISRAIARYKDSLLGISPGQATQDSDRPSSIAKILFELHGSPFWPQISQQFDNNEQRFYEDQYANLIEQFGQDIVGTEILQVHQLINYIILGQRALSRAKQASREIDKARRDLASIISKNPDPTVRSREVNENISRLQSYVETLESRLTSHNREFKELDSNQQDLMKQLKGTREQRVKTLEQGKLSFFDLLREIKDIEGRKNMNRQAQLSKIAMEKRTKELSKPIKYADGSYDSPVLSPSYMPEEKEPEFEDPDS